MTLRACSQEGQAEAAGMESEVAGHILQRCAQKGKQSQLRMYTRSHTYVSKEGKMRAKVEKCSLSMKKHLGVH